MNRALKNLVLYYQPIVSLSNEKIIGAEALVRKRDKQKGLIFPSAFIPQAEKSGKIVSIGHWVLAEICRQINEWKEAGLTPVPIALNVCPVELFHPYFVTNLKKVVSEQKISPDLIKIELTETFPVEDIDKAAKILTKLKEAGFIIYIDDFGTGYASLKYLTFLPIHAVKIDRMFIQDIPKSLPDAAIISAVTTLAHQLKLKVVAEGVERKTQLHFLKAVGCHSAQGNYFYKPLTGDALGKLLKKK